MAGTSYLYALAADPDSSTTLYNLGSLYYARRQFELAALWFERTLERDPSNMSARALLGLCYAEAGQTARARRTLELALREDPKSVEVWLAASNVHLKRKDFPRALAAARQAERLERSPRTARQLYLVYREM